MMTRRTMLKNMAAAMSAMVLTAAAQSEKNGAHPQKQQTPVSVKKAFAQTA